MIELRNEAIVAVVNPHQGVIAHIGRHDGANVLGRRTWPVQGSTPTDVDATDDRITLLRDYPGGWHVLFPNVGRASRVHDTRLPFHGDLMRSEWEITRQGDDEVTMSCTSVIGVRMTRSARLDGNTVLVTSTIENLEARETPVCWGEHLILDAVPGAVIQLPRGRSFRTAVDFDPELGDLAPGSVGTWPTVTGAGDVDLETIPQESRERFMTVHTGTESWAGLTENEPGFSVGVSWNGAVHPFAWLWMEIGGAEFPWFGASRLLGIEPCSSSVDDGVVGAEQRNEEILLGAQERRTSWVRLAIVPTVPDQQIVGVDAEGAVTWSG